MSTPNTPTYVLADKQVMLYGKEHPCPGEAQCQGLQFSHEQVPPLLCACREEGTYVHTPTDSPATGELHGGRERLTRLALGRDGR